MNPVLARTLSVLFHPLLLPTYLFSMILYYLPESVITMQPEGRMLVLLLVFVTTFLLPAIGSYIMMRTGQISSFEMADRRERRIPLFFTALCYSVTTYLFYREPAFDRLFYYVMFLTTLAVFLTYCFTIFWKISAHGVALGGALGIMLLLSHLLSDQVLLYPILIGIMLSGLVLTSRLALHAHTTAEVFAGFLMGFSIGLGMWLAL